MIAQLQKLWILNTVPVTQYSLVLFLSLHYCSPSLIILARM